MRFIGFEFVCGPFGSRDLIADRLEFTRLVRVDNALCVTGWLHVGKTENLRNATEIL